MRPHHYGYLALVLCISSMAGCSSCKKGKDAADAAPEAAAASMAMPMDSASAAPMDAAAPAESASAEPVTEGAKTGGGALLTGLPPKCKDTKGQGTSNLGVFTLTPAGAGGVTVHGKEATGSCSKTDDKHLHCKWTMLPGTKNSNLKTPAVTKGWTLTMKEGKAPDRYFYGTSYFGGDFSCHETP